MSKIQDGFIFVSEYLTQAVKELVNHSVLLSRQIKGFFPLRQHTPDAVVGMSHRRVTNKSSPSL